MTGITPRTDHRSDPGAEIAEQEYESVLAAILLVASGRSPKVTVANLRFLESVIAQLRGIAAERQVRLVPLWTTDEGWPRDVIVEPLGPDA